jgi:protein-S-isoprenylcysteine O-methyltransferase Ste14
MVGFLLQWPTIPTLAMFPILVWVYRRLALAEEREVAARFGPAWIEYAARTPRFYPGGTTGDKVAREGPAAQSQ